MSKSDNDVTVEVVAPRSTDIKKFTWPKSTLVGAAADEAATAFGYEQGTPTLGAALFHRRSRRVHGLLRGAWQDLLDPSKAG